MTLIGETRKQRKLYCECSQSYWVCSKIHARTLVVSRPGSDKKWYGTHVNKPDGEWEKTAEGMMLNFAESGHPVFCASSTLERAALQSKGKGVKSINFKGSDVTIELILRTVISVNQLHVCGTVTDLCRELVRNSRGTEKPAANENLESIVKPTEFPTANRISQTDTEVQGNLLRNTSKLRRTS